MRLEDIAQTQESRHLLRIIQREKFGFALDREPVIAVVGVGKVAELYAQLLATNMNSLLYKPKVFLVGREKENEDDKSGEESHYKREYLSYILRNQDKERFISLTYDELAERMCLVDLMFVTLGAFTDAKDRELMIRPTESLVQAKLSPLPFHDFPGILNIQSNVVEVNATSLAKVIALQDMRQLTCGGPIDLTRNQIEVRDGLDLRIEPHRIRFSGVGGYHQEPYVSTNRVLVEDSFANGQAADLRDITPQVREFIKQLKKSGTTLSEQASKIAFTSFDLYQKAGRIGTPTAYNTALSMLDLTRTIINRIGTTAVSCLSRNGIWEYGLKHFNDGCPEDATGINFGFNRKDIKEIQKRRERLVALLRKYVGEDYRVDYPTNNSQLFELFTHSSNEDSLEERIIVSKDSSICIRNEELLSKKYLASNMAAEFYVTSSTGKSVIVYRFNGSLRPRVSSLTLDSQLDERELRKSNIEQLARFHGHTIGLTRFHHNSRDDEYRFVVWNTRTSRLKWVLPKFSASHQQPIEEISNIVPYAKGVLFNALINHQFYTAQYDLKRKELQVLFPLSSLPLGHFDYNQKILSVCQKGLFLDGEKFRELAINPNWWTHFLSRNELLFYNTQDGLWAFDLPYRTPTMVTLNSEANDVLEYNQGIQVVTMVKNSGILVSDYDSREELFEGTGNEYLIDAHNLGNIRSIHIQDPNMFFVIAETRAVNGNKPRSIGCHAVYHDRSHNYVEPLLIENVENLELCVSNKKE